MAGRPAAVVINTAEIIVLNAGNLKKESRDKHNFHGSVFNKTQSENKDQS
jgi:hypothetical protein